MSSSIPSITASKSGDLLIHFGPGKPVLFVSHEERETFLAASNDADATEIIGVGAAALTACLIAGATLTDAQREPLVLRLRMPNGLSVLYMRSAATLAHPRNAVFPASDEIIVTPEGIVPNPRKGRNAPKAQP
jgi:hypothetical protein